MSDIRKALRTILLAAAFWACCEAVGQQLKVTSFAPAIDPMYSSIERRDANGEICALVKFQFPYPGLVFEGQIVGSVDYKDGEYWVYFTDGQHMFRIKGTGYYATEIISIRETFGIRGMEGNRVYKARIESEGPSSPPKSEPQKPRSAERPEARPSTGAAKTSATEESDTAGFHRVPANLDIAVEIEGQTYFISAKELKAKNKSYKAKGITVIGADDAGRVEGFILVPETEDAMTWSEAMMTDGGGMLPTRSQAEIWRKNRARIAEEREILKRPSWFRTKKEEEKYAYGKTERIRWPLTTIWLRDEHRQSDSAYATEFNYHFYSHTAPRKKGEKHRVAKVLALPKSPEIEEALNAGRERTESRTFIRTAPQNLDLAFEKDGERLYVSMDDIGLISGDYASGMKKLGVAIVSDTEAFIYTGKVLDKGKQMKWDKAVKRFGTRIPSYRQARHISYYGVERAFRAYEIRYATGYFWTRTASNDGRPYKLGVFEEDVSVSEWNKDSRNQVAEVIPLR